MMQRLLGLDRGHLPGALHAFAHRQGALGDGNNVEQGEYTIEEAAQKCVALGAAGFTHHGAAKPSGRVLCYFKSSQAGNADPNWQSYTLDSTLIYQRAVLLKAQQNYDDAGKWFTQAIAAGYEDQAECHNQHGECLEKLGSLNDALKEFDQALSPYDDGKPHEARFLYNRGKALFKSGMPEARFTKKVELLKRAEVDLQQALMHIGYNHALQEKIHGRTASITTELAQMAEEAARRGQQLYETQLWSEAFAAFSESLSTKHGNQSKCLFLRAMCSIQKQQPDSAIKDLDESLQLMPMQPEAVFQRANCKRTKRDLKAALVDMNRAAELGHAGAAQQVVPLQQEIVAEGHYLQAQSTFNCHDFSTADQMCAKALAVFPAHSAAIALQTQARSAMSADVNIAHGRGLMRQAKTAAGGQPAPEMYEAAGLALAEAVRQIEKISTGLEAKISGIYYDMAVCDINGPNPLGFPHAEMYCTRAIEFMHATKLPMPQQCAQPHMIHTVYMTRARVRHSKGDLKGARSDLRWLNKQGGEVAHTGWGISADSYYYFLLRNEELLWAMSTAPAETVMPVEVYLNERYVPVKGWSSNHLLPVERGMFSHADGNPEKGYSAHAGPPGMPSERGLMLPLGWQWTGPWEFDKDGIQYAFNWSNDANDWHKNNRPTDFVRRRRLVRHAIKQKSRPLEGSCESAGATLTQHAHLPVALPVALPAGVSVLSTNHPVDDTPAAAPPRNGLTLAQAIEWCQSMADCSGMWYYDNGRTCPKAHWDPSPANFSRVIPGGKFYQVKPLSKSMDGLGLPPAAEAPTILAQSVSPAPQVCVIATAVEPPSPSPAPESAAPALTLDDIELHQKVWLISKSTSVGVVLQKRMVDDMGPMVQVDFSESGGQKFQWEKLAELGTGSASTVAIGGGSS